ncbi:hypothetical protein B9Z55_001528 [Caenorhabditis nigoni]|uniref:HTH CENPB-type domain-containing protein n=2 Tax=Caenorhabditis nigoni TaxID=1611254 RepID=A0A2G5VG63_9PELO|nr:hypothetical protein B9Z55_001528 [Caenorhabditis nigoni]
MPLMATSPTNRSSSSPSSSKTSLLTSQIDEAELEQKLFHVYTSEVKTCDDNGQSTQHIGDEWMRREIRKICAFDVSDRWIKMFRRKHGIRYFSGRRHADKTNNLRPLAALDTTKVKTSNYLKERRVLRTSRKEYVEVDLRVHEEIIRRQARGERLTNPWIREYAQNVANELHSETVDVDKFFDANWLYRFKRRYCVELKPRNLEDTVGNLSPPILFKEVEEEEDKFKINEDVMAPTDSSASTESHLLHMMQIRQYLNLINGESLVLMEPKPTAN